MYWVSLLFLQNMCWKFVDIWNVTCIGKPHSQLGFRCWMVVCSGCCHFREPTCLNLILNLDLGLWMVMCFGCFHFRDPTCVNHILNLDSRVEFCVFLDALNSESLHLWTTFSTWIQVLNGCVFWVMSLPRAYMSEPDSQLWFRSWMVMCFGCFHLWKPTCVNHILNLDVGVQFCGFLDAFTSDSLSG